MGEVEAPREHLSAYDRFSRSVELPLTVIGIAWLPILVIPLVVQLSGSVAEAFDLIDYLVWAMFVVEYMIKFGLAPDKRRFVKTHLLDLAIVVIPFFRPLRALRSIRSLTVLFRSATRARSMFTHHGMHFVVLTVTMAVFAGAGLELSFEARAPGSNIHTYGVALWWALTTVTTVGYGDHYPVSAGGRGVSLALIFIGLGSIGLITASIASFFIEEKSDPLQDELRDLKMELSAIRELLSATQPLIARPPILTTVDELDGDSGADQAG